jgi:streptomycin 6-kinase
MSVDLPSEYVQNMLDMFGDSGAEWLANLPHLLEELAQRWSLRVLPPFVLSYNYVAPVIRADGSEAVLKVGHPDLEMDSELAALKLFNGRGICRLLDSAPERGAMLLERLRPGQMLSELPNDDEATRILAQVMQQLWVPAPPNEDGIFITLASWAEGFQRLRQTLNGTGPFPARLVAQAEETFAWLSAEEPQMLLHGDLHHFNVISAERAPWLALDPKGVIGNPYYDCGPLMYNPWPEDDNMLRHAQKAPRRLDILHEQLSFDRQRLARVAQAQALLSAWWTYEEHHRVSTSMIQFAEALEQA